jgi:group II intron reverse transcriptase/maturase
MREDLKAIEIYSERGKEGKELERVYRMLRNRDLFLTAYSNLYANQGALTPGTDPNDTIEGMSVNKIDEIIHHLEAGTYQWKPSKRVYILKKNGKLRPLGLPGWKDKLLQEAIRILLTAYYEPQFSRHSHGFRPQRGCHTALKEINLEWRGTAWFIQGDIKGCFDNINHDILLEIIGRKIKDNRFIKLLKEMLAAGYLEDWHYNPTFSGTPQGGVISPLLSNIYLNELDKFVEEKLMPKYHKPELRKVNPEWNRVTWAIKVARKKGERETVERLVKERNNVPHNNQNGDWRALHYVRYADDFLLGFKGPKKEAEDIKAELRDFLKAELKLEMSEDKTPITHASTEPAKFLSYEIRIDTDENRKAMLSMGETRTLTKTPMLRIPRDVIVKWSGKAKKEGINIHRTELLTLSDYDIVQTYDAEVRGIVNYYLMAVNVSRLYSVKNYMMESLVKTLATKHQCKTTRIYRKHIFTTRDGLKAIKVVVNRKDKPDLVATFGTQPIRYQRMGTIKDRPEGVILAGRTQLIDRIQAEECELCGDKTNVQVHHINKLKDYREKFKGKEPPDWLKRMMEIRRKTLVVCHECHVKIHNGTYDGKSLKAKQ